MLILAKLFSELPSLPFPTHTAWEGKELALITLSTLSQEQEKLQKPGLFRFGGGCAEDLGVPLCILVPTPPPAKFPLLCRSDPILSEVRNITHFYYAAKRKTEQLGTLQLV